MTAIGKDSGTESAFAVPICVLGRVERSAKLGCIGPIDTMTDAGDIRFAGSHHELLLFGGFTMVNPAEVVYRCRESDIVQRKDRVVRILVTNCDAAFSES